MALVVILPIGALMIAVLRNGGTLIKPSVPVVATQQDYERLASEYSGYFEIGEDLTINLNLDRDIDAELEMLREQAYNEYVEIGSIRSTTRLGEVSGELDVLDEDSNEYNANVRQDIDYTDYEVWTSIDLESEIILNEISEQDRELLKQYQAMLSQVNGLVEQGIMIPVLDGDTLKYELVEQEKESDDNDLDIGTRITGSQFNELGNGRNSFEVRPYVQYISIPVGMKWFCQIVWGQLRLEVPVGYDIHLSIAAGFMVALGSWMAVEFASSVIPIKANTTTRLMSFLGRTLTDTVDEIFGFDVFSLVDTILLAYTTGKTLTKLLGGATLGIGLIVEIVLSAIATLVATYMLNRIGMPLIAKVGDSAAKILTSKSNHNTIKIQSDLIFLTNSFGTLRAF
jgi:hypothetical protein